MGTFFQKLSRTGILLMLAGIMILVSTSSDLLISFKSPKTFDDAVADGGLEAGDRVKGQVPFLLDAFALEETWQEDKSNNSRTPKKTSRYYYVLPCGDGCAGLSIGASNAGAADRLVEETYEYLTTADGPEPSAELVLDARVAVMDEELSGWFQEELEDYYDYTPQDIAAMGTFLMIEPCSFTAVRIGFALGAALTITGALVCVKRWRRFSDEAFAA